jgi:hypothetical protein
MMSCIKRDIKCGKLNTVDKDKGKAAAGISTIFVLPTEFRASDEVESDGEVAVA